MRAEYLYRVDYTKFKRFDTGEALGGRPDMQVQEKQRLILLELGYDEVTATQFVEYISEKYSLSKSGIWYLLKKMKREGLVDFPEKGEQSRPLSLTKGGAIALRSMLAKRIEVAPGAVNTAML